MKKALASVFVLAASVLSATVEPTVSGVTARQNWPWNGNVEILYTLSTDEPCDVEVSATWQGQPEPVVLGCVSGDCTKVSAGNRRIVWDPVEYGAKLPLTGFRVTVTPVSLDARKYLTLNLVDGSVAYSATEPDWRNNQAEFFYTNMIFRRISATSFDYGYPENLKFINGQEVFNSRSYLRRVTLSSDYYIAIFPTTTTQEQAIRGESEYNNKNLRVPTRTVYNDIRGSREQGICWPETFHKMAPGSLLD